MKKFLISSVLLLTLTSFGKPIGKINKKSKDSTHVTKKYPCHPLGDLYPCTHPLHYNGDLGPCTHYNIYGNRIHTADLYPCTHPLHYNGDLYPCSHICY